MNFTGHYIFIPCEGDLVSCAVGSGIFGAGKIYFCVLHMF